MSSTAAVNSAIRSRFFTVWGSETAIHWPNLEDDYTGEDSFVSLFIQEAASNRITNGSPAIRRTSGLVTMRISVKANLGDDRLDDLVDLAKSVFRDWTHAATGLRFRRQPYETGRGPVDSTWYQASVISPYEWDYSD